MASIADTSTALHTMEQANNDFLELINNLKNFIDKDQAITFNLASGPITVNSLQQLIKNYRDGRFDEIILGGQSSNGRRVKLSVNPDGYLQVTDPDMGDNTVLVKCAALKASHIKNSTVDKVTADSCTIKNIKVGSNITGGRAKLDSLELEKLSTDSIRTQSIDVSQLEVSENITCSKVYIYGTRKLLPARLKNVFYKNNAPISNAYSEMHFNENGGWIVNSAWVYPPDCGFIEGEPDGSILSGCRVPDMVKILGENRYKSFVKIIHGSDATHLVERTAPYNMMGYASIDGTNFKECPITGDPKFSALIAWPTGIVSMSRGNIYLTSFLITDLRKDVYYNTGWNEWPIYRTMVVTVENNIVQSIKFDNYQVLPKFTCARFIVNKHDPIYEGVPMSTSGTREIVYSLESA